MIKLAQIETDCSQCSIDFTKQFFNLAKLVLLSENIKFPIEKANILPNKLYHMKYDYRLISDLTRNLFEYTYFETVSKIKLTLFFKEKIFF